MHLTEEQRKFYEQVRMNTRMEIEEIDGKIQEEMEKIKQKLADLQNAKTAAMEMYAAACKRLGIPNDLAEEEEEEAE